MTNIKVIENAKYLLENEAIFQQAVKNFISIKLPKNAVFDKFLETTFKYTLREIVSGTSCCAAVEFVSPDKNLNQLMLWLNMQPYRVNYVEKVMEEMCINSFTRLLRAAQHKELEELTYHIYDFVIEYYC